MQDETNQPMDEQLDEFTLKMIRPHKEILQDRGLLIRSAAEIAQRNLVSKHESKYNAVKMELLRITDMSPKETTSLRFIDNFNGDEWAEKMHALTLALLDAEIELKTAKDNYTKWFAPKKKAKDN